jgi:hypothetical protein
MRFATLACCLYLFLMTAAAFGPRHPLLVRHGHVVVSDSAQNTSSENDKSKSASKQAIQAALETTKKYGAQSPEARVAWEIAEEMEDSVFSPCSKRCDYPPAREATITSTVRAVNNQGNVDNEAEVPLLFVQETKAKPKSEQHDNP